MVAKSAVDSAPLEKAKNSAFKILIDIPSFSNNMPSLSRLNKIKGESAAPVAPHHLTSGNY